MLCLALTIALSTTDAACLTLTRDLTALEGVYLHETYIATTKKTRDIYAALRNMPMEIVIDAARTDLPILIDTQHEGWGIDVMGGQCVTPVNADTLTLTSAQTKGPLSFIKVANDQSGVTAYLSKLIGLEGCYREQRTCFHEATVTIDGKDAPFSFQRDPSELGKEGNYVKVGDDALFWAMKPTATGWRVYHTTWQSDDAYVKPDLAKPWRVLTRR
jgi:hypothetical protein